MRKKDGVYRPVINLKTLNLSVLCMQLKMESLQTLKYMTKETDYMCKIDLKDAYFTVPIAKSCRDLMRFLWEANLYGFVSMFWSRISPSSIYQNFESPNIYHGSYKYQNFDLPGRHVVDVSINRKASSRKRHRNLSPSTFGICNKL